MDADPRHPDGSYDPVAKVFHWVTVPLMAMALASGFTIAHVRDASKLGFYAIHESLGLTILLLSLARIAWRQWRPPPPLPEHLPLPLRRLAKGTHHALYAVLVLQPLLGFFATNAFGFPMQGATAYLGFIDLPKFMDKQEALAWVLLGAHQVLAWLILPLLLAHVAAAIWHHAIRRDGMLLRML
ncbi:MAG: cytochrome b/b6 domain-containing protein [Rhodovarius sp.]|nr:cytochrome b/b6 domain-containing protein [Rhodovarius sp.]MCX7932263.1 cytochrome b/b6 domain-containing protein [Rhodovarius sp.]MDW8314989.1 cytochrome b/b6 domain-containing protein [Rhodovarius sp.]